MNDAGFEGEPERDKDRNFITALARGLDVLRCFRPHETVLTNQDISARTDLPKPTVSRLTHTLCKLDYLVLESRTGTYRLGAGVLSGMEIGERAAAEMRALRNGPNSYMTCALGERHRSDVVYVAVHRSLQDVSLTMHVVSRLPLFVSAIGRAILVGLDTGDREKIFEFAREADPGMETARHESYARAREEYEAQGYCTSYGDWRRDVNGIAVPVFSLNGSRVYGLNVGGPKIHVKKKQLEGYYARRLVKAAKILSLRPD